MWAVILSTLNKTIAERIYAYKVALIFSSLFMIKSSKNNKSNTFHINNTNNNYLQKTKKVLLTSIIG